VTWLRKKENFDLIEGKSTDGVKSVVAGLKTSKKKAYEDLAAWVWQKCGGIIWSVSQCENRYKAYKLLYRTTLYAYQDTTGPKFCLSDEDLSCGIKTIKDKLEKLCPGFNDMDELFGGRQNINPSHTMTNSDSEDEDESLPNSLAIEMLESQPVYNLEESQNDDMMMNEVMDREFEEEEQLESPKEISNVPTLDLTQAVLLRHEDGGNELIGVDSVGMVSIQSSSSGSLSSLSINTGNASTVKKGNKTSKQGY
jgi:hypothetical protein